MTAGAKRRGSAERVVQILREEIIRGNLRPSVRLSEESLGSSLGVARNTLREAFRILSKERLVVHVLNRGVFVRELTVDDIADLYRLRRAIELEAMSELAERSPEDPVDLSGLQAILARADVANLERDWPTVGTADLEFHAGLVGLAGSGRLSDVMVGLLAELRLAFRMAANVDELHSRYLMRNKMLLKMLEDRDLRGATTALRTYLADSQTDILRAYRQPSAGN